MSQSNRLTIKIFTTATLMDFVQSDAFKKLDNYPITEHRARSHAHNPRSDPDDPILYLAYDTTDRLVGYRLLLVDKIITNHTAEKVAWYSCVWVHPQHRGQGIAKKLVSLSLKDWGNTILFQGAVKESKQLYSSTGIFSAKMVSGFRGYLRFNLGEVSKKKFPKLKKISFLITPVDIVLNMIYDPILRYKLNRHKIDLSRAEEITSIDEKLDHYIRENQSQNLFKRSKEEFHWIWKYPWIKSTAEVDHVSNRYHFSSIADPFKYINIKLSDNEDNITGFVISQIRDRHLTVQYAVFSASELPLVIGFIKNLFKIHPIDYFTTYHPLLADFFNSSSGPFWYKKKIHREFNYSTNFEHYFEDNASLHFQAGDGDMIFT